MRQRLLNWLADTWHFAGGMFYWNLRKSAYVWRDRFGQCPCQNESDDSIAGHVRCDAVLHWKNPERFRKICPLLTATPEGWRCSVPASAVRPYWGRVIRWCALTLLVVYLAGAAAVFIGLRVFGRAPVNFAQVAWPTKWHEIREVQSAHLFRQAMESFRQGRLNEAFLELSSARQHNPAHYEATLLMAQVVMFQGSFSFSDELFSDLWRNHLDRRQQTAVVYHDTLLSLDRMKTLAEWSVAMAKVDSTRAVVWVRSALLAIRSMRSDQATVFATEQAVPLQALSPHAQLLLRAELAIRSGGRIDDAVAMLRKPYDGPFNSSYASYQIARLAELGAPGPAQNLLDQQVLLLGPFDMFMTQVELSKLSGDEWSARGSFHALLKLPLTKANVERIACLLIRHPDASLYRELNTRIQRERALAEALDGATLWITGVVCDALREASYWQTHGQQYASVRYPALLSLNFASRNLLEPNTVNNLLNVVSFPREVVIALLWRVSPQAVQNKAAKSGARH